MQEITQAVPLSVSVEDAARIVGHSRTGIYGFIAKGEIKSFKIGRRRVILVSELNSFVERAAKAGAR